MRLLVRSEEHTSELQSQFHLVCRLLLEKKNISVAAVFVLRRKFPHAARPYRMWGYPFTLVLFLAVSVWFIVTAFLTQPWPSFMSLVIVSTGVLAFWTWRRLVPLPMAKIAIHLPPEKRKRAEYEQNK